MWTPFVLCPLYLVDYNAYTPPQDINDLPKQSRVSFYVHHTILEEDWSVQYHNDHFATLSLVTPSGIIRFHNVYNRNKSLDKDWQSNVEKMVAMGGSNVLLGDFNLHHLTWGVSGNDNTNRACDAHTTHSTVW